MSSDLGTERGYFTAVGLSGQRNATCFTYFVGFGGDTDITPEVIFVGKHDGSHTAMSQTIMHQCTADMAFAGFWLENRFNFSGWLYQFVTLKCFVGFGLDLRGVGT